MIKITKKEFKQLHKGNKLRLLGAGSMTLEDAQAVVREAINGAGLPDGIETSKHGFIDNSEHTVYKEDQVIYLVNDYMYGARKAYNTTVYKIISK